ncbi:MBL fold metallo-hydrolase [Actinomycetospora lutea]|uniref:MBL fold metallo-hydrolase n=1 Tax=Actinomycetospora lutea TaxID=663604 RepID=UPI0023672A89|nr:MBL fold metallo-hydrolase [Actinomycetospora lutea]MDD7939236.1 MBL fold metallo-hydrolase [Actinomycetospora lutea]
MAARFTEVADGVHLGALAPAALLNTVLLEGPDGDVVVDAGFPWSARRLAVLLRGRHVAEHAVTHAHGDHVGASAWLCRQTGAPLAMGAADAGRFEDGRLDTHSGRLGRAVLAPLARERRRVDRRLAEGDRVAGFTVLSVPGHSPGTLALWRAEDRVLIVGDGPVNVSGDPRSPRWLPLPRGLHDDPGAAVASRRRLAALRPDLVVALHGRPVASADRWARAVGP